LVLPPFSSARISTFHESTRNSVRERANYFKSSFCTKLFLFSQLKTDGFAKIRMLRCAASFVIAAYEKYASQTEFARLACEFFTKPPEQ
jgi:hypothetical protein